MSLQTQVEELRASIAALEAQRGLLGDKVVDPALAASRQQLAVLEERLGAEAAPADERRLVTILFTDMVGSTSTAERLDPEEWRQLVSKLHETLGNSIVAHHGTIAQYLGDGLLAFFGAKEASEEDPENAIRAALDAQAAAGALQGIEKVQIRAGIHTGLVVVGELGADAHKEFTASGDAMNLAARLQSAAPPGGILISHDTYRYVRGVFDLTPRPPLAVKGKSEPVQTYLVRQAKPRPFRTATRGVMGAEAATVGREAEMEALHAAYLRAYEEKSVAWAQLLSDPGMGKSRLISDMDDWLDLRLETYWLLRARATPDDVNQPFALIRRLWFDRFQIAEDAPLAQAEAKWVERFRDMSGPEDVEEAAHALGLLVGLPFEGSPHIGAMRNDPTQIKGRAFVVSRELVRSLRRQNPVVVMLDDLQWADSASWEYLNGVFLQDAEEQHGNGMFILATARPQWEPTEPLRGLLQSGAREDSAGRLWGLQISLKPLSDGAMREMARDLLRRAVEVPEHVIDLLVERSEGVPYYAEEMVNWFMDHGILDTRAEPWRFVPEKLREQPLPATLQHLLLTRLSSLSQPERAALQRGAIFGRHFWTGGVEALGVAGSGEVLGHLQPRGFVRVQPESAFEGDTEWSFDQSLLQEVTYESVLKRERASLHKVAAAWLEKQAGEAGRLDEFAGLLGDHCERGGELEAAADWYLRAGRRALEQGAPREAVRFCTQALALLPPIDRERRWQGLTLREQGYRDLTDAEPWKADLSALLDLARDFGDDPHVLEALIRNTLFCFRTGQERLVIQTGEEALEVARRSGNEAIEAKALGMLAAVNAGDVDASITTQRMEEALQLARRVGDERVLSRVLHNAAFAYFGLGMFERPIALQREQIELDHRLGNRADEAAGLGNLAAGYFGLGLYKQARAALEQAHPINEALGASRQQAYDAVNLAEIYLAGGDLRRAHQLAEQAAAIISPSQDVRGIGFVLELQGLVLLAMGDAAGARRRFAESQELASKEGVAALACESAAGLASCSVMQGQLDEARRYAAEAWAYLKEKGWKGLDTPGRIYLLCAETFSALGDTGNANSVIEAAHAELMAVAQKIENPAWRQSFLENVPGNRGLMALWERRKI